MPLRVATRNDVPRRFPIRARIGHGGLEAPQAEAWFGHGRYSARMKATRAAFSSAVKRNC